MSAYKPKIYRSQDGCCICKAKSSSSRFTDSGKYQEDCRNCFKLQESRQGEICNACVLIVKRWKKLPSNTQKNWAHVVDARTGPGTKNIFKQKKKDIPMPSVFEKFKHKHVYKRKPVKTKRRTEEDGNISDSAVSTRSESPSTLKESVSIPTFLDNSYWSRRTICCGVVYLGQLGEAILDLGLYQSCHSASHHLKDPVGETRMHSLSSSSSSPSMSASSPSSSMPSSIESLVEAELKAFQTEDEEFYADDMKMDVKVNNNDFEGDEGFCDKLDQKSEQFRASLSLIASH